MKKVLLTITMVLAFGVLVLLIINACADTDEKPFRFHVPEVEYWQDTDVSCLDADDALRLAYRESGNISADMAVILVPGSTRVLLHPVHQRSFRRGHLCEGNRSERPR